MTRTRRQKRLAAARAWQAIYDLGYSDGHHAGGEYPYPHEDARNPHLLDGEEFDDQRNIVPASTPPVVDASWCNRHEHYACLCPPAKRVELHPDPMIVGHYAGNQKTVGERREFIEAKTATATPGDPK